MSKSQPPRLFLFLYCTQVPSSIPQDIFTNVFDHKFPDPITNRIQDDGSPVRIHGLRIRPLGYDKQSRSFTHYIAGISL